MKNYISPATYALRIAAHTICAGSTPKTGKVTFTLMVDNGKPAEIEL